MQHIILTTTIKKEKDAFNLANLIKNYFNLKSVKPELQNQYHELHITGKRIIPFKIEQTLRIFGYRCKEIVNL